jgi:hypothetical protein
MAGCLMVAWVPWLEGGRNGLPRPDEIDVKVEE